MIQILSGTVFILGAMFASLIGVIAERIHTGQSFTKSRSRCDMCKRTLGPLDLVPIFSWLFALGKCRTCKSSIPVRLFLLEVVIAFVFLLTYLKLGVSLELPLVLVFICILTFVVLYDLRHTLVPPMASMSLVVLSLLHALLFSPDVHTLGEALFGGGLIGLGFLLLHVCSGGRAMGLGDAPIAFALAVLVTPYAFSGVLFSFWIGALIGLVVLFARRGGPKMGIEIPFVPFLAVGFLLAYFIQWTIL